MTKKKKTQIPKFKQGSVILLLFCFVLVVTLFMTSQPTAAPVQAVQPVPAAQPVPTAVAVPPVMLPANPVATSPTQLPDPPSIKKLENEVTPNDVTFKIYKSDPYVTVRRFGRGSHSYTKEVCYLECKEGEKLFIRKQFGTRMQTTTRESQERMAKLEVFIYKKLHGLSITPALYDYYEYDGYFIMIIEKMNQYEFPKEDSDLIKDLQKIKILQDKAFSMGFYHNDFKWTGDNLVKNDLGDIFLIDFGHALISNNYSDQDWKLLKIDQDRKFAGVISEIKRCSANANATQHYDSILKKFTLGENKRRRISEKNGTEYVPKIFEDSEEYIDWKDSLCSEIFKDKGFEFPYVPATVYRTSHFLEHLQKNGPYNSS